MTVDKRFIEMWEARLEMRKHPENPFCQYVGTVADYEAAEAIEALLREVKRLRAAKEPSE